MKSNHLLLLFNSLIFIYKSGKLILFSRRPSKEKFKAVFSIIRQSELRLNQRNCIITEKSLGFLANKS